MQRPRTEREDKKLENFLVNSQNELFGTGGVWESCSHRCKSIVILLSFDSFIIVKGLTGTARGMNDVESMLICLFHLGLPMKAFYRSSIYFEILYYYTSMIRATST